MPPQQQQPSPVLSGTISLPTTVGGAIRQPPLMMPTTPIPPVSLQASGVMLPPPAVVRVYLRILYSLGYMPSMGFKSTSSCVFCKTNKVIASFEKDKLHLSLGIIHLCITYRKVFPLNFLWWLSLYRQILLPRSVIPLSKEQLVINDILKAGEGIHRRRLEMNPDHCRKRNGRQHGLTIDDICFCRHFHHRCQAAL